MMLEHVAEQDNFPIQPVLRVKDHAFFICGQQAISRSFNTVPARQAEPEGQE
jgi:hypothetical protein